MSPLVSLWFCTHCGEPRPLKWGYAPSDRRYALVVCETKTYPAVADRAAALALVAARVAAAKARNAEKRRGPSSGPTSSP
jgi:hypothetical protein